MELIGTLGAVMLVAAWLPPTINAIIKKKSQMNVWFEILFFVGAGLLVVYSINTGDYVFIALNALAALFAFINLQYIPNKIKKIEHDVESVEHEVEEIIGLRGKTYYHLKKRRSKR